MKRQNLDQSMSTKMLMTVEDFAELNAAETEDYELVEGDLIPMASGNPVHAKIRQNAEPPRGLL